MKRKTPLVKPQRISLIIDAEGVWTNHLYDSVSVTTVGAELQRFLDDGWSLWSIFMEGMHYLSRIRGNYIMVGRHILVHEARRGEGGEPKRLQRLRRAGVTDDDIYLAGLTRLTGPPSGVENELWQRLLDAGVSNDDIYCAGVEHLAGFPSDVQAAMDELDDD